MHRSKIEAATYQIKVKGWLDESWAKWFDGLAISNEIEGDDPPVTVLTGPIVDQAALYGILLKIQNLGLALLAVNCLKRD